MEDHQRAKDLLEAVPWQEGQFIPACGGLDDYSSAYRNAARELAGEHQIGGVWALPIVFLYRHAIELLMKATLIEASSDEEICPQSVLKRSHNLKKQLPDLRKVAESQGRILSAETEKLISAWNKYDSNSMKVRYPVTMDGQDDLLEHSVRFHLKNFVIDCEAAVDELQHLLSAARNSSHKTFLKSQGIPH